MQKEFWHASCIKVVAAALIGNAEATDEQKNVNV